MAYWVSEQGDRYHFNPDCHGLRAGQMSADAQEGYQVHVVQRIESLEEAIAKAQTGQPCRARDCQPPAPVQR